MSETSRRKVDRCSQCGEDRPRKAKIFDQWTCDRCVMRIRRAPRTCLGCDDLKVVAFLDADGQQVCATCAGQHPRYACATCGREDNHYGSNCAPCTLQARATALLTDPTGQIHPQLQPVFDALVNHERPQTPLYWFTRSIGPDILRGMAKGEVEISHAAFNDYPSNRTVNYLREFLAALGVLPAYDAELERMTPWLTDILATLPKDRADLLERFARWQVLRKLRLKSLRGQLTHGSIQNARATINATVKFLGWLEQHDTSIETLTQTDLDHYLSKHPCRAQYTIELIAWTHRNGLTSDLTITRSPRTEPAVTLSHEERWSHVELLLHDDTIRRYTRVAGLFTLLFAQPLARICRMRADQVQQRADHTVTVTFDTVAIELPEPLDRLVLEQLARRGQASYASRPDPWLFPGGIPGRPMATESIRGQLVERGIHPFTARKAALFQLAGEIPTPVLAELLGLSNATAVRYSALASRSWSQYMAQRASSAANKARNQ